MISSDKLASRLSPSFVSLCHFPQVANSQFSYLVSFVLQYEILILGQVIQRFSTSLSWHLCKWHYFVLRQSGMASQDFQDFLLCDSLVALFLHLFFTQFVTSLQAIISNHKVGETTDVRYIHCSCITEEYRLNREMVSNHWLLSALWKEIGTLYLSLLESPSSLNSLMAKQSSILRLTRHGYCDQDFRSLIVSRDEGFGGRNKGASCNKRNDR